MTPKEKAQELVYKFSCGMDDLEVDGPPGSGGWIDSSSVGASAKQCAIICVDEILSIKTQGGSWDNWENNPQHYYATGFWRKVKEEIEAL
jgi:hypothetical protein